MRIPYYLLDAEGYLYKTDIDREQLKDVSDKEPEIYERMKRYSNWFKDELLADFPKKDTRPFIIGHPQETCSKLPARCEDIWPDRTLQPLSELFLFYELEKPGSGDKLECGG